MEQDKFALVEKILKDVDNIMSKNAELYAFDIVPVDCNYQNKSPVLHLENCLGLESWCVKHVYMYCYSELMDSFTAKTKRKPAQISTYNSDKIIRLLNVTLLLNPELSTLWNKRREIFQRGLLDKAKEIKFTKLVLSRKPKSNDTFAYRRWIIVLIFQDASFLQNCIQHFITEELHNSQLASEKSPNNYHSWNHRIWFVKHLQNFLNKIETQKIYTNEYIFSECWCSKHISDFSCFHYRQFCIKNVLKIDFNDFWIDFERQINIHLRKDFVNILIANFPKDNLVEASENDLNNYSDHSLIDIILSKKFRSCNCKPNYLHFCKQLELLFHEIALNNELIRFYKLHETLWYHRRFIIHEILDVIYRYFGLTRYGNGLVKIPCSKCQIMGHEKQAKIVKYDSNRVYAGVIFKVLQNHESSFISERQKDGDNYADRHEKYLKCVKSFDQK